VCSRHRAVDAAFSGNGSESLAKRAAPVVASGVVCTRPRYTTTNQAVVAGALARHLVVSHDARDVGYGYD
jgi:hypothetical protein